MVHQALIEIVAAQMVITRCCQNLDNVIADLDDGNIECAAAQVIHHDLLRRAVVQTVCQRSACGLIDDTQHIQAGNTTRIFGCLLYTSWHSTVPPLS